MQTKYKKQLFFMCANTFFCSVSAWDFNIRFKTLL